MQLKKEEWFLRWNYYSNLNYSKLSAESCRQEWFQRSCCYRLEAFLNNWNWRSIRQTILEKIPWIRWMISLIPLMQEDWVNIEWQNECRLFEHDKSRIFLFVNILILFWFYLIWFNFILFWFDLIWFDLIWFDLIWFDLIWFDLIWFFSIFIFTRYGIVWQIQKSQFVNGRTRRTIILRNS